MLSFYGEIIVLVILAITLLCFAVTAFYAIKFAILILQVQDAFEDCIESLDERQEAIDKILQIPLFYDSPEIRRVLSEIRLAKQTIINAAQTIGRVEEELDDDNDDW